MGPSQGGPSASGRWRRGLAFTAAALATVALVAVGVRGFTGAGDDNEAARSETADSAALPGTDGPSMAVLPFRDTNVAPGQGYFGEGLREDIVAELSRYPELTVLSAGAAIGQAEGEVDVRKVGEGLGVRYVLQGGVRRADDRIRVTVQLSDTRDGRSVWGNRYERDLTARDLFELQDELTQQVVNAIAGSYGALARAELPQARSKPRASLASYDCVLRTYDYLQDHVAEKHLAARECLEEVLEDEPDYAEGQAWLGYLYAEEYHHRRNARPEQYDALERALERARLAVSLDDASAVAHGVLALTHFFRGDYEEARIESYRTVELSPNNALWLALLGTYLMQQEDYEGGLAMVRRSIALDPHPPPWIDMGFFYWHYREGRYEEALAAARKVSMGDDYRGPLQVAAALGQLGRVDEAQPFLEEMREHWGRPLSEMRRDLIERNALAAPLADHMLEGLVKAGLELSLESPAAAAGISPSP